MANKRISTIEDLAALIQRTMASKEDVLQLKQKVDERFDKMDERFDKVDERFDKMDERFDKVEHLILENHRRRIEMIETDLKRLKEALAL